MANTYTGNFNLVKPEIGQEISTWGQLLNNNADTIDLQIKNAQNSAATANSVANGAVAKTGDTMSGQLNAPTFKVDSYYYLTLASSQPVLAFDAGDYILYDRSINTFTVNIGPSTPLSIAPGLVTCTVPVSIPAATSATSPVRYNEYIADYNGIQANLNNKFDKSGGTVSGDITAFRPSSPTTGVIYLGNTGTKYLYNDGSNYNLTGQNLFVNGSLALLDNNASVARSNSPNNFTIDQVIYKVDPKITFFHTGGANTWSAGVESDSFFRFKIGSTEKLSIRNDGVAFANNFAIFSDESLKTNIVPIDDALDKVLDLNGVNYTLIETGERHIGLIAQEVEKVIPECVTRNGDLKAVDYAKMVGLLIEAIKELNDKIEELEARS